MDGIIILAHGSKRQETEAIMDSLVNKVKNKTGLEQVHAAYLQFSEQSLEATMDRLVENGAKRVTIVPMFIFDGVHVTQDIPEVINFMKTKYTDVEMVMSRHIGDDDKLADIVVDRIINV